MWLREEKGRQGVLIGCGACFVNIVDGFILYL